MPSFIRFTLLSSDTDSGRKTGVLVAAHQLRDDGDLSVDEHNDLRLILSWFNQHLKIPKVLSEKGNARAISWFKTEAKKPLERMWALKALLDIHDINVEVHKTTDPGMIIYEDGWQVVAKPRKHQKLS